MTQTLQFNRSLPASFTLENYKKHFNDFHDWLVRSFEHQPINGLVKARARFVDTVLSQLWQHFALSKEHNLSLIAVGGYGRGELHPYSDIDLLILSDRRLTTEQQHAIASFITSLWDLRLEVGHSVRTLKETIKLGKDDITIATNLLEMRLLTGNKPLFEQLQQ